MCILYTVYDDEYHMSTLFEILVLPKLSNIPQDWLTMNILIYQNGIWINEFVLKQDPPTTQLLEYYN